MKLFREFSKKFSELKKYIKTKFDKNDEDIILVAVLGVFFLFLISMTIILISAS